MASTCRACGAPLDGGARFCEKCGAPVMADPPPAVVAAAEAGLTTPRASAGSPVALLVGGLAVVAAAGGGAWWFSTRPVPVAPVVTEAPEPVNPVVTGEPPSASPAPVAAAPTSAAAVSDIVVRTPEQVAQAAGAAPGSTLPEVRTTAPALQGAPRNHTVPASPPRVSAPAPTATQDELLPAPASASSPQRETATEPAPHVARERASSAAPPAAPEPTPSEPIAAAVVPAAYSGPRSGTLSYSGRPVIQNGEIVFERLPPLPLKLTYDTAVWSARVAPGSGNTQRIILRNTKPGTQKTCVVRWDIVSE